MRISDHRFVTQLDRKKGRTLEMVSIKATKNNDIHTPHIRRESKQMKIFYPKRSGTHTYDLPISTRVRDHLEH